MNRKSTLLLEKAHSLVAANHRALSLILAAFICSGAISTGAPVPSQRVGLPLLLEEIYLPGPELEPLPRKNREAPLIVRLIETKHAQDGFRYTFEIQGLDPGTYNLGDYLREVASESGTTSPHPFPLTITTSLPPGLVQPAGLQPQTAPRIGGYRSLLWVLALVWLAGLAWLFFSGRGRVIPPEIPASEPTLAERMKPLLQQAAQGKLPTEGQARLERLILAQWRKRLPEIELLPPAQALIFLRNHEEASPLLRKLEYWLHAPESEISPRDIEALLAPYQI